MYSFIKSPCLPENKVAVALISSEFPEISDILNKKYNIKTISINKNSFLTEDIASHPDCVYLQLNHNNVIIDSNSYESIVKNLTIEDCCKKINFYKTQKPVQAPYPEDVILNIRVIGNNIICNSKHIDTRVKEFATINGYKLIHSNQGYSACSTILVDNNALITDDESIYRSALNNAIDCIHIKKGSVRLKRHEYGFIGGTYGMIEKKLIAFTGKLDTHDDADIIKAFLAKYKVRYVELSNGPLIDIGGIIPIAEVIDI